MKQVASVILAAGKGTRMKSSLPKVLHKVCGKPMLSHVISSAKKAGILMNIVVNGHEAEKVENSIGNGVSWVYQLEQLGTGHAVKQAEQLLKDFDGTVLVLCGDTPLITSDTLTSLLREHEKSGCQATVLTAIMDQPAGYGRIIRDARNSVEAIVEHKDATPEQQQINEINTGIYCFNSRDLFVALGELNPANAQGEYYLTDVLSIFRGKQLRVGAVLVQDHNEVIGINNRVQLSQVEKLMRYRVLEKLMLSGVTIIDPDTTYIDAQVRIEPDTIVHPGTIIEGNCFIYKNSVIGPSTRIKDSVIGKNCTAQNSVIIEAVIGNGCNIGPFAYLRPGSILHDDVKIGDFVEIKKSIVGFGSKIPHLSYIGDAEIGDKVNIGAGTITCNYNGIVKSATIIEDGAFIGSNTNLVAPVRIGEEAVIGAGSTVTRDVPKEALCVERSKQEIYPDWKARKNAKK